MQQTSPTYFFHVHIEGHVVVKNDSKIPHSDTEGHPDSGQVKSKEQPTLFYSFALNNIWISFIKPGTTEAGVFDLGQNTRHFLLFSHLVAVDWTANSIKCVIVTFAEVKLHDVKQGKVGKLTRFPHLVMVGNETVPRWGHLFKWLLPHVNLGCKMQQSCNSLLAFSVIIVQENM